MENNNQDKSSQEEAMKKHLEEQEAKMGNAYANEEHPTVHSGEGTVVTEKAPEPEIVEEKPISLGKVVNKEFVGREEAHLAVVEKYGWQKIAPNNLPTRRKGYDFYPDGIKIMIRSADTPQVRHWSEIDENDPFSIDEGFNDMLTSCCKVSFESGMPGSYKDILEEDRIYILLEIRRLTYPEPENQLVFTQACQHCEHENEMKLENDFFKSIDIDEKLTKYYNPETKSFVLKTKSYGDIEIKPPTIGIMQAVSGHIQGLRQQGKRPDMTFIKILPYIAGTWKGLNAKRIKEIEVMYTSWPKKKFSLMLEMCGKARVGIDAQMYKTCSSCQEEVTAPITFPSGVKALFVVSDFSDELL